MSSSIRILRVAQTESARRAEWLAALQDFPPESAKLLKHDGGAEVHRAHVAGRDTVIKSWRLGSPWEGFKVLFRQSRADRHWRGADWLIRHRIPTARMYTLATRRDADGIRLYLVMEALPGKTILQHLADPDLTVRQEHAVARSLGEQAAAFMYLRHYNRDPKPSNQIVTSVSDRTATVALIDCVGIKRNIWFDSDEPIPMLARMVIESSGVGLTPRRTLLMRGLRSYGDFFARTRGGNGARGFDRAARNQAWRDVAEFIELHGDPTPRVNPLAPSR